MKPDIQPHAPTLPESAGHPDMRSSDQPSRERSMQREHFLSAETILVPVDFSESSRRAAEYAACLAAATNGTVWLLHVLDSPSFAQDVTSAIESESDDETTHRASTALEEIGEPIRRRGINARILVRTGKVTAEIADAARQVKADLIVIPTRGSSGSGRLSSPGTTETVTRTAPCPVLSLRRRFLKEYASRGVSHGSEKRQLVVPVDFSDTAARTVRFALRLSRETSARLTLLHVVHVPAPSIRTEASDFHELSLGAVREAERQLAEWASRHCGDCTGARLEVRPSHNPVDAIEHIARKMNPDLIILGSEKHSWIRRLLKGSLQQNLIRHLRTPVLCLNHQVANGLNEETSAQLFPRLRMRPTAVS